MNKYALLSIVPGLGQLYLGDKRKGILFLEVALINYLLLVIVCFSQAIANAIVQIGRQYSFTPNNEMIAALNGIHFGSPTSYLLIGAMVVFWRYATCDAAARAEGKTQRRPLYRDSAIEFSEATSGSYVGHVALMIACLLLAVMFVQAPKRPAQILDIEFMEEQDVAKARVTPKTHLVSTKDVESHSRQRRHDEPRVAHQSSAAPSPVHEVTPPKPAAPQAVPKPMIASRPAAPAHAPSPAPPPLPRNAVMPAPAPMTHAVSAVVPTPVKAVVMPSPVAPAPAPPKVPVPATAVGMAPGSTSRLIAAAPAIPILPSVRNDTAMPSMMPSAIMGVNTAGVSRIGPPTGAIHMCDYGASVAAPPIFTASRGTEGGAAPDIVALAPSHTAGRFPGGGSGKGAVSPIKASQHGDGTNGTAIAVAPALPRSGAPGTSGDTHPTAPSSDGTPGKESVGTKAGNPDFSAYMAELQRRIKKHWFPPKTNESRKIIVQFKVALDGTMSNLRITQSSGVLIADQSALRAVEDANPFKALPKDAPESVDIEFTFDYNVFTGGASAARVW